MTCTCLQCLRLQHYNTALPHIRQLWKAHLTDKEIVSKICKHIDTSVYDIPMITQSDPGTENFGIANTQTLLRQMHDPALEGYIQHWWMHTKKNIKPEIAWSQLRCHFSPGFESLLDMGVDSGWYDPNNMLQLMVFQWVFIPWLQCCNKRKVLPHGIPELIYTCLEDYGALNFKIMVSPDTIEQVPSVGRTSTWTVYCNILDLMWHCEGVPAILTAMEDHLDAASEELNLLPGLHALHKVEGYMGGIANGLGLRQPSTDNGCSEH
ncbi:hypothetical protein F5J12DRAFT_907889 [Pisolithus orientalis]|uniref:uncharacterized protein n=1 Tax=Pisolithus orientalis TaxID=936130 RepID=UPI002225334F|nr:uncharacterized protein F5J12DRAFT_907889 [Pisolithus orientalis]KAI5985226.1 hypothetical protein F5J12DRAFT_907889 [Pisolithus orientalis]